jgi:hypothetical protein
MTTKPPAGTRPANCFTGLLLLTFGTLSAVAQQPSIRNEPTQPIPKDSVQAWQDAGARVGRMRHSAKYR